MLGGKTLDEKPIALFLNSGDIAVMSKESRLCYHGVPKILKAHQEPWTMGVNYEEFGDIGSLEQEVISKCVEEIAWKPYQDYIRNSRININVRQVLKNGQSALNTVY